MAHYRLYFFNPHDGHISRFEEFDADGDDAAAAIASERIGAAPLELWQGGRKVRRFEAIRPVQPALRRRGPSPQDGAPG
jgi:hypothetical protein